MPPPDFHRSNSLRLVALLLIIALGGFWILTQTPRVLSQGSSFKNFESPQVHPLALTPDGTRLLAVNSPNATLSVFQLVSGSPVLTAEIPVGFEPVSVVARNNREAWVVNWMSDSVSIVDLTIGNVVRTIDVGDEPTDVIFAGPNNSKAFVCVSGGGRQSIPPFGLQVTGASGAVKVFDANNPASFPITIEIPAKQPRALARNADGSRVYVSVFESGNQTTIVPEPVVLANGGLPPPNPPLSPGLPVPPNTSLIVKWDGSNWRDEINRSWTAHIPYTLRDLDVVVLDAANPLSAFLQVRGIGTHIGNMAFNAAAEQLIVANLEDINQVRFEPNLNGKFQASRVSILNAALATPSLIGPAVDLNSHVDFGNPGGSDAERALSLALPADIVRQSDGTVYVAATSSARVGVLSSAGAVNGRISVGLGPTGLALDEPRQRLYVLNRFDQTLSVVDTSTKSELSQVSIGFNPEPASVRNGRRFLYDATNLSAHGTVSCASCHLNGHRDGMVWDLGNPQGSIDPVTTSLPTGFIGADNQHPMKGPMMTQSLRGIIGNEPFHWRGDRAALENFNGAFVSLLGGRLLTNEEMAAFKAFVQSLAYPPNPNESHFRPQSQNGFFSFNKLFGNNPNGVGGTMDCDQCHLINNFAIGTDNKITPKADLHESQSVKVPHFRGIYQKVGMKKIVGEQITGFGFTHDGSFDTLFNFQKAPQFDFGQAGSEGTADSWRFSIDDMLLRFDSGTAPAVGLMVTVDATNKASATNRISLLDQQAGAGNCDLIVRGFYFGSPRSFLRVATNMFQSDSLSEPLVSLQTLLNAVGPGNELTFMGVPPGEGRLFALDRDGNGILNDDEPRASVSITGRAVNASGIGLAGVAVTLSGTQSATAVTDANGNFVFNLISINGAHTVTPSSGGVTFFPANRTFTNPSWNQSATFIAASGANASDASVFFVTQHYNDFLNREPDAAGLAFWVNEIEQCGADAACREVKRVNVSAAFYLAIEHQETGFLVYRAYKLAFGNLPGGRPVPIVFADLMNDTQRVGRNVRVGIGDWQAQLQTNQQAYFMGLVQRPEFLAQFPASMLPVDFVNKLNVNSGNAFTDSERADLVTELTAGGNTTAARAAVLRRAAGDQTLFDAEFRKAFVLMQYYGYLRRNPDSAPDTNFNGWQFWLNKLNEFNGNFVHAEMVKAFITSIEYRQRFGQ